MDAREFYDRIVRSDEVEWLGVRAGKTPAEDEVLVYYRRLDSKFAITVQAIRKNTWKELVTVIRGLRSPQIMMHVTRIVGYYSQLQNWNRSKIAELKDRHLGDYSLPEKQEQGDGHVERQRSSKASAERATEKYLARV